MLKLYIKTSEAVRRLRTDNDGVVSFEYVIVAACICGIVIAVFANNGNIATKLNDGLNAINLTP
jgi:Flp pilus assembly pilin Flp